MIRNRTGIMIFGFLVLIVIAVLFSTIIKDTSWRKISSLSAEENKKLKATLPKGWIAREEKNKLAIISPRKYFFYNAMNMPLLEGKELEKFAKSGMQSSFKIYLTFVPKWSSGKIKKAEKRNKLIGQKLKNLSQKYKISHLVHKIDYLPRTEAEKKRVEKFERESQRLESELQTLPVFHTEKYSVFVGDNQSAGFNIWPAEEAPYRLKDKLKQLFLKEN